MNDVQKNKLEVIAQFLDELNSDIDYENFPDRKSIDELKTSVSKINSECNKILHQASELEMYMNN